MQGNDPKAVTMLRECEELAKQLGDVAELALVAQTRGLVAAADADFATATRLYEEAYARFQAAGDAYGEVEAISALAAIAALAGDVDLAARRVDQFITRVEPGERWLTGWVLWALGISQWRLGDNPRAVALEVQSMMLHRPFGDELGFGSCVAVLARTAASDEQWQKAAELFGASRQALAGIGSPIILFGSVIDQQCRAVT
jgi:hypothetical protein